MSRTSWGIVLTVGLALGYGTASSLWRRRHGEGVPKAVEQTLAPTTPKKISPKVFIISMFEAEAKTWFRKNECINLKARTIRLNGMPTEYRDINCTADGDVCQITIGMGLINASLSIAALTASPHFDLSKTFFLIAGVGGINPTVGTLGSVIFAKYVIQVDLQYEIDAREIPSNWRTGYFPQGSHSPSEPPKTWYGTEVFELNANLRDAAVKLADCSTLNGSQSVRDYCKRYAADLKFNAALMPPSVITADVASSNVFFHGHLLSKGFSNACQIFTNRAATYGITAQEDSGILAALLRAAAQNKVDFSRIILLRAASNFDQPPAGEAPEIPIHHGHGGFPLAIDNIYRSGISIIKGILRGWDDVFEKGIREDNYIGDVWGTLGGKPDFGPSAQVWL